MTPHDPLERRWSMKRRLLSVGFLLLAASLAALAQSRVTATGTAAVLSGDAAKARDRALESALRTAVEQVIGTMVDSETLVQNNALLADKIFTQTRGYVANYRILSERPDPDANLYSVTVEAEVREGNLADDLGSLGLLIRRMKMPRLAVAIEDDQGTAKSVLERLFRDKGFLVVETSQSAGASFWGMGETGQTDLLKRHGAEVVVLGRVSGGAGGTVGKSKLTSYQAVLSLKALKTDTRELLGTASGTGTAIHVGEAGFQEAARQAAMVAGNDVVRQITAQWAKESSSTRMLTLEIQGSGGKAQEVAKRLMAEGRGVQEAVVRESSSEGATLGVFMQGDASDLAQEIRKLWPRAKILSQSANRLTVAF